MKIAKRLEDLPEVLRRRDLHAALPLGRNTIDALLQAQIIENIIVNRQRLVPRWAVLKFLGIGAESLGNTDTDANGRQKRRGGNRRQPESINPMPGPHRR